MNRDCHTNISVVLQDFATQWIQSYPCKNKAAQETVKSLHRFLPPEAGRKTIYTDTSLEFIHACENLKQHHDRTDLPDTSETEDRAERVARQVRDRTSRLVQSGLHERWWREAMDSYCYLRIIQYLLADGKSLHERRFGIPFDRPI